MNPNTQRTIESLRSGKVTAHKGYGNSMLPVICSGQRQILVPILSESEAKACNAERYRSDQSCNPGDQRYLTLEDLSEGDAVYCKVGSGIYTHEIVGMRGKGDKREFQIAPHHRKHVNGWTRIIYGKCVRVEG